MCVCVSVGGWVDGARWCGRGQGGVEGQHERRTGPWLACTRPALHHAALPWAGGACHVFKVVGVQAAREHAAPLQLQVRHCATRAGLQRASQRTQHDILDQVARKQRHATQEGSAEQVALRQRGGWGCRRRASRQHGSLWRRPAAGTTMPARERRAACCSPTSLQYLQPRQAVGQGSPRHRQCHQHDNLAPRHAQQQR